MNSLNEMQNKLIDIFLKENTLLTTQLLALIIENFEKEDLKKIITDGIDSLTEKQKELITATLFYSSYIILKDKAKAKKIINQKWNNLHYSERLYKNRTILHKTIKKEIEKATRKGANKEDIIKRISKRLNVNMSAAKRLLDTELTYSFNKSIALKGLSEGYEKFKFIAVVDGKTSDKCLNLHNRTFLLKDMKVGVNVAPLHPYCRSRIKLLK